MINKGISKIYPTMANISKLYIFLAVSAIIFALAPMANAGYYEYAYNCQGCQMCNYHAYRDCQGSAIYWYDSCSNRQDLFQDCAGFGQTCQYGQCVIKPPVAPPYIAHYKIACHSNDLYWFNSLGTASGLYRSCSDGNSCTADTCSNGKCANTLNCNGSACQAGSADYISRCATEAPAQPAQPLLTISFLGKKDPALAQWSKAVEIEHDSTAYFLLNVINNSGSQADNVSVSANIPSEIYSLGNLKINDTPASGDIVSGISLGAVAANSSRAITFEGRIQNIQADSQKQATANVNVNGTTQSDSFDIRFKAGQGSADANGVVSEAGSSYPLADFLKRWYVWILAGVVIVFLFIVVYRRVSSV